MNTDSIHSMFSAHTMSLQERFHKEGRPIRIKTADEEELTKSEIRTCQRVILDSWPRHQGSEISTITDIENGILVSIVRTAETNLRSIAFELQEKCGYIIDDIRTDEDDLVIKFKKPPRLYIGHHLFWVVLFIVLFVVCFAVHHYVNGKFEFPVWHHGESSASPKTEV